MPFDHRIALYACARLLAVIIVRCVDTSSGAVKGKTMITALQRVPDALTHRQGHKTVWAAILDSGNTAIRIPEHDDLFVANFTADHRLI